MKPKMNGRHFESRQTDLKVNDKITHTPTQNECCDKCVGGGCAFSLFLHSYHAQWKRHKIVWSEKKMREFMLERYVHLNLNSFVKLQLQTEQKKCVFFSLWKKQISRIIFFLSVFAISFCSQPAKLKKKERKWPIAFYVTFWWLWKWQWCSQNQKCSSVAAFLLLLYQRWRRRRQQRRLFLRLFFFCFGSFAQSPAAAAVFLFGWHQERTKNKEKRVCFPLSAIVGRKKCKINGSSDPHSTKNR